MLSPGLHIGLILTLAFIIFKKSSSQLFENHPCLYLLAFGLVIAKISNKLVVRLSLSLTLTLVLSRSLFIEFIHSFILCALQQQLLFL